MAVFDYNLVADDVLERIPFDTRQIQQSTGKVSKDDIDTWIEDIASTYSGMLEKHGLDGSDLADEALTQIQEGIKAGVAARCMQVWGHTGSQYEQLKSEHDDTLARYEEDPQRLDRQKSRYQSNVDSDNPTSDFHGTNFEM